MRILKTIITLFAILFMSLAWAERGYYSAPRWGAEHRAGAFYGNGPITAQPPRGSRGNGHSSRQHGYNAYPRRGAPYPYNRRGGDEYRGYDRQPGDGRYPGADATIEYGNDRAERPYNPHYHGHDRRRRELERHERGQSGAYGAEPPSMGVQ